VERAFVVHAPVSEEEFQLRAEAWEEVVKNDFPHAQTVTEWTLAVTEKEGMPVLDPANQTLTLRQTFWRAPGPRKEQGMQLWPQRISFNVLGSPENPRRYEDLDALIQRWLPKWATHFGVRTFSGVTMEYVNILSAKTLPTFVAGSEIQVGEAVRMFQMIPGKLRKLIAPFDFQVNVRGETDPASQVTAQCLCPETPLGEVPTLQLRFRATTNVDSNRRAPLERVQEEARLMHGLIITQFEAYFTELAKKTFEPYGDVSSESND
jgi:hypothetical protein